MKKVIAVLCLIVFVAIAFWLRSFFSAVQELRTADAERGTEEIFIAEITSGGWKLTDEAAKNKRGEMRLWSIQLEPLEAGAMKRINLSHENVETVKGYLTKYLEWVETAKKNEVGEVKKEIGRYGNNPLIYVYTFNVFAEKPTLEITTVGGMSTLDTADVKEVAALLTRLPETDAVLKEGRGKPKDPTKALFK